jgi:CheY-like chemotaxis protein
MTSHSRPRILVVDDEDAILETMTFTFEDDYEVFTSTDARRALDIIDQNAPIAVVLTDQRMPNMSGIEFVTEVCKRNPSTVRMILTGFSDMEAIIQAINDGHVYAYITKPWEPDQLKQLMKQAVEHYHLSLENERLLAGLQNANVFLEAVMDHLDTGAIAVDSKGVIQAVNRPVRDYLGLQGDLRGRRFDEMLEGHGLMAVGTAAERIACDAGVTFEDVELSMGGQNHRYRVVCHILADDAGDAFGRVILVREISHESLRSRFDDLVGRIVAVDGELRAAARTFRGGPELAHRLPRYGAARGAPLAHAHGHRELDRRGRSHRVRGLSRRAGPARPHAHRDDPLAAGGQASGSRARAREARGSILRVRREPEATRTLSDR